MKKFLLAGVLLAAVLGLAVPSQPAAAQSYAVQHLVTRDLSFRTTSATLNGSLDSLTKAGANVFDTTNAYPTSWFSNPNIVLPTVTDSSTFVRINAWDNSSLNTGNDSLYIQLQVAPDPLGPWYSVPVLEAQTSGSAATYLINTTANGTVWPLVPADGNTGATTKLWTARYIRSYLLGSRSTVNINNWYTFPYFRVIFHTDATGNTWLRSSVSYWSAAADASR